MFTPAEIERIPLNLEQQFKELEFRIMEDVVERIKINNEISRSADWKIYRLQQLGKSKEEIKNYIKTTLNLSDKEVNRIYNDVIEKGYARDERLYNSKSLPIIPFKDNLSLKQFISAVQTQTNNALFNITQSMGFAIKENGITTFKAIATYYQDTLDKAIMDISSGAFSYNEVLNRTVSEMTNSGLRSVDYASGWSNRVDVASRRAVMTGFSQIAGKITEENANLLNTDVFEVDWHMGARPAHQVWQGRVYTKAELISVCGLGTGPGLNGWNCYHSYYPFVKGASERTYTDAELDKMNAEENTPKPYKDKKYTAYEATQRQRALETTMRAQRDKISLLTIGGASENVLINAKFKYRAISNDYVQFSKSMKLPEQRARVSIDGLKNIGVGPFTKPKKERIINSGAISGALNPDCDKASEHAIKYYESVRHMKTDCKRIAKSTGYKVKNIEKIKNYVFLEKHLLNGEYKRFAPSFEMGQSWQRLIEGKHIEGNDIILLKHETLERAHMLKGRPQDISHTKASIKYKY